MRLAFAARADDVLAEIGDYIARENPTRALSYVGELRAWCTRLKQHPLRFPAASEFGEGIRRAAYGNYIVFYSVHSDHVLIERVIHSARKLDAENLL